jgi:hypothetical protein
MVSLGIGAFIRFGGPLCAGKCRPADGRAEVNLGGYFRTTARHRTIKRISPGFARIKGDVAFIKELRPL